MKKYSSILVTGSIAYDDIMDFPARFVDYLHPEKLHQINVSFVVDRLEKQMGGTGLNIAYNIQLSQSESKPILLAAVGKDSKEIIRFCRKNKIGLEGILTDKELYTATGKVITDISDNQIWGFYYGACIKGEKIDIKKYFDKKNLLIISANHPKAFLHYQAQAIELGIDYLYDPGMGLTWISDSDLKKGCLNAKWLVGNDYEITMILKRLKLTVKELVKKGVAVITTLGQRGVKYDDKENNIEVCAYKVKKVVDPTGAGDAWRAGFIARMVSGDKIVDCLKFANALASVAVESYGTVNHHMSYPSIKKRALSLSIKK